jgi:type IV secretion system protein VirB4
MFKVERITKDWKEAGALQAHINLYGFWDEHAFLTKSGDIGAVLKIGGIDYESLDHAGRDYAVMHSRGFPRTRVVQSES